MQRRGVVASKEGCYGAKGGVAQNKRRGVGNRKTGSRKFKGGETRSKRRGVVKEKEGVVAPNRGEPRAFPLSDTNATPSRHRKPSQQVQPAIPPPSSYTTGPYGPVV